MRHLYLFFFIVLAINLSAQIKLINESYYEFPVQEAVFAKTSDTQPAWVLIAKDDATPSVEVAVTEVLMMSAPNLATMTAPTDTDDPVLSTEKIQEVSKADKALFFILKPNGTRIDLGLGERMIHGTENEIVTYCDAHKKIRKFAIKDNYLQLKDSLMYSEMTDMSSYVRVVFSPNNTPFYVAEMIYKSTRIYTLFTRDFKKIYELKLQKSDTYDNFISFSAPSDKQIRAFYTGKTTYNIVSIETENGKKQEIQGECACQSSTLMTMGIVEMRKDEYVVYHGCYDSRSTVLYAYTADNQLKWTRKLGNYFNDFAYLSSTQTLTGRVYSVPYSGFITVNATDGKIIAETPASASFAEVAEVAKAHLFVYMPMQLRALPNGKKTICSLNGYSPTNSDISKNKLVASDGKTEQGLVFPDNLPKSFQFSLLGENRISVLNGNRTAIYEIQ